MAAPPETPPGGLPDAVAAAHARAQAAGFALACEPAVGQLLALLAAAVPAGGRVLELGTGVGVGLAWLVHGLGARRDAAVISVDLDDEVQRIAREAVWPTHVRFEQGDGAERVRRLGSFDLIFADAPGGKLIGLDDTIAALRPGGVLAVDDMDLARHANPKLREALVQVRETLLGHPELVAAELTVGSGMILAVRRQRSAIGAV